MFISIDTLISKFEDVKNRIKRLLQAAAETNRLYRGGSRQDSTSAENDAMWYARQ